MELTLREGTEVWKRMKRDPLFVVAMKRDFSQLTGYDFGVAPEPLLNTANLLAAIDRSWTAKEMNRIILQARRMGIREAFNVSIKS